MYMFPHKCIVTGATSTAQLAEAQVPVWCEDDQTRCVQGPKQMIFWNQLDGNNVITEGLQLDGDWKSPGYNQKMGYREGAQTDIFLPPASTPTSTPVETPATTSTSLSVESPTSISTTLPLNPPATPQPTEAPTSAAQTVSGSVTTVTVTVTETVSSCPTQTPAASVLTVTRTVTETVSHCPTSVNKGRKSHNHRRLGRM